MEQLPWNLKNILSEEQKRIWQSVELLDGAEREKNLLEFHAIQTRRVEMLENDVKNMQARFNQEIDKAKSNGLNNADATYLLALSEVIAKRTSFLIQQREVMNIVENNKNEMISSKKIGFVQRFKMLSHVFKRLGTDTPFDTKAVKDDIYSDTDINNILINEHVDNELRKIQKETSSFVEQELLVQNKTFKMLTNHVRKANTSGKISYEKDAQKMMRKVNVTYRTSVFFSEQNFAKFIKFIERLEKENEEKKERKKRSTQHLKNAIRIMMQKEEITELSSKENTTGMLLKIAKEKALSKLKKLEQERTELALIRLQMEKEFENYVSKENYEEKNTDQKALEQEKIQVLSEEKEISTEKEKAEISLSETPNNNVIDEPYKDEHTEPAEPIETYEENYTDGYTENYTEGYQANESVEPDIPNFCDFEL